MLSAIFVIQGVRAIKNPDPQVPKAKPLADQVVPLVKRFAPATIADRVPDNPRTLVRLNGVVQLVGGLALATGQGRRAGAAMLAASMIPTTLAGHPFWEEDDPAQRAAQQTHFLKNVCMFGGLLLAAVDTEGKPGLAWRARHGAKDAKWMAGTARREARTAAKTARREARLTARAAALEAKLAAVKSPPGRAAMAARRKARLAAKAAKVTNKAARTGAKYAAKSAKSTARPVLAKAHLTH